MDSKSSELILRSDSVSVLLTPLSEVAGDIDSIGCSIQWTATGIGNVQTEGFFYRSVLVRFQREFDGICKDLKGETELNSVEEDIKISVNYEALHVRVTGFLTIPNSLGILEFSFESDPSFQPGRWTE